MEYRVSAILRVETVLYTGRVGDPVKRLNIDRLVRSGMLEEIRMDVSWEEYGPRLLDQCAFNIACLATVKDTNFEYFAQDDFRVRKPDIQIMVIRVALYERVKLRKKKIRIRQRSILHCQIFLIQLHNEAVVGQTLHASAKFRNPLPIPLRKCRFLIEGPGLDEQLKLKLSEPVEVNADAECSFSMMPKLEGRARIAAKFYSRELEDVDGHSQNFIVRSAKVTNNSE